MSAGGHNSELCCKTTQTFQQKKISVKKNFCSDNHLIMAQLSSIKGLHFWPHHQCREEGNLHNHTVLKTQNTYKKFFITSLYLSFYPPLIFYPSEYYHLGNCKYPYPVSLSKQHEWDSIVLRLYQPSAADTWKQLLTPGTNHTCKKVFLYSWLAGTHMYKKETAL